MLCRNKSSPTIENVVLAGNFSATDGGAVACTEGSSPRLYTCRFQSNEAVNQGGGLYCQDNSNPLIQQCIFDGNISRSGNGGAVSVRDSKADIVQCEFIGNVSHYSGGAVYLRNGAASVIQPANIFNGNRGCGGNDLASWGRHTQPVNARDNLFLDGSALTEAWVLPTGTFDVSGHASAFDPVESNLFVSLDGDDVANDGLSPQSPFRTIRFALSRIQTGGSSPLSVILAPGVYSSETNGELFPLPLLSNVSLIGPESIKPIGDCFSDSRLLKYFTCSDHMNNSAAILQSSSVNNGCIRAESISGGSLQHLVLTGETGPGLFVRDAAADCRFVTISGFHDVKFGAGVHLAAGANVNFSDTTVCDNSATVSGGGLYFMSASSTFTRCRFIGNQAVFSGGGVHQQSGSSRFEGCAFTENIAAVGGAVRIETGNFDISSGPSGATIFDSNCGARGANLSAAWVPAIPYAAENNIFDVSPDSAWSVAPAAAFTTEGFIITGQEPLIGATVYVAPGGDDSHDGLTPQSAFRTISHSLKRVIGLPYQPATVMIDEGLYADSTGEWFPLCIPPYVQLKGADSETSIIAAEIGSVIDFYYSFDSSLENCNISSGTGPGVTVADCAPEINNVKIHGCTADVIGAGMALIAASPMIRECVFFQNASTKHGGAIHCGPGSNPSIIDCLFENNSSEQMGGAILSGYNAHAFISFCEFKNNFAVRNGGAIAAYFGHVTVGGCVFSDNRASRTGGAIHISQPGSDLAMAPNVFKGNSAAVGCDLAADVPFTPPVSATGNHFDGIPISDFYVSPVAAFDISGCTGAEPIQSDVYVAPWGDDHNSGLSPSEPFRSIRTTLGRLYSEPARPSVTVHLLEGEYFLRDEPWPGTLPLLSNVTIEGITLTEKVTIDAESIGNRTGAWYGAWIDRSKLSRMTIKNSGASAIDLTFCDLTVDSCRLESNSSSAHGGAIVASGGLLTLTDCVFTKNFAAGNGGAVDVRQYGNFLATNCIFFDNDAGNSGGAVSSWMAAGRVHGCAFKNNWATKGGGWSSRYDHDFVVTGSIFEENMAETGGGIHVSEGRFSIIDTLFAQNTAWPFRLISGFGGGGYFESCKVSLINCTVADNSALGFSRIAGGGIAVVEGAEMVCRDSILWGNHAEQGDDIAVLWRWKPSSARISWSIAGDGSPESLHISPFSTLLLGEGTLYSDPLFVSQSEKTFGFSNSIEGDFRQNPTIKYHSDSRYRLSSLRSGQSVTSPCIDSGSKQSFWISYMTPDSIQLMNQRSSESGSWPDDGLIDMGWHPQIPKCHHNGDVDDDGLVTWRDVERIFQFVLGEEVTEYGVFCAADLDLDGAITSDDARLAALNVIETH
ncbi:MAG: right-handed parallel beta-helix repeat-containing protein [bacterium]